MCVITHKVLADSMKKQFYWINTANNTTTSLPNSPSGVCIIPKPCLVNDLCQVKRLSDTGQVRSRRYMTLVSLGQRQCLTWVSGS